MFTGIITEIGRIKNVVHKRIMKVEIESRLTLKIGDSISVDGVCLTVVEKKKNSLIVEVSQDTAQRTTLRNLSANKNVNLELPLKANDYLSGHFVLGHIDTTAKIAKKRKTGNEFSYSFLIPEGGKDYIVPLGSIAIDGISLTVKEVTRREFNVTIIPETIRATTIGSKKVGDLVNLEYDLIARYVKKWNSK